MPRVLVTGSGGYIGQVLMPLLSERGWDVVGLDSGYFEGCDLPGCQTTPTAITKDVRDVVADDLAGFAGVIHLAGLSNDPLGELDHSLTGDINLNGTMRLAEAAREAGVPRFVFSSSCSVYGAKTGTPVNEEDPVEPLTSYAENKILAEEGLAEMADDRFCPVYLRNATVYGLSPRLRFDLVVNNLAGWAHTTGEIKIMSDGTPWRPLIHVADVSAAFIAALEAPTERVWNERFNVGSDGHNFTVRDIAEHVNRAYPDCRISFNDEASVDPRSYRVDFSKVRKLLPEFEPRWTLEAGIVELRDALLAQGITLEDFQGPKFTRLKRIQELQRQGGLDAELRSTACLP